MESVIEFARDGGLVLGICNGFQVLCEARLLPGALLPNVNLRFIFRQVELEVVQPRHRVHARRARRAAADHPRQALPGAATTPDEQTLAALEERGQVVLRYAPGENFNGSLRDIAGVCNEAGNVIGLMPHPEHAVDALTAARPTGLRSSSRCAWRSKRWPRDRASRRGDAADLAGRPRARPDRARVRADLREAGRPAQPGRAGDVLAAVERALRLQALEEAAAHAADRGRARRDGPGRERGRGRRRRRLACAFKVESHNHPSAVEPFQGAATGVGGILRDIFAIGARPIAVLDSLRFGEPRRARARATCSTARSRGSATTATRSACRRSAARSTSRPPTSRTASSTRWRSGLRRASSSCAAPPPGPGNVVVLFGASTGRDGIGGASVLASAELGEDDDKRPTVQVGDPVRGEEAARVLAGAARARAARRAPGPRRRRPDLLGVGDGLQGRRSGSTSTSTRCRCARPTWSRSRSWSPSPRSGCSASSSRADVDAVLAVCEKWEVGGTAIGTVTDSRPDARACATASWSATCRSRRSSTTARSTTSRRPSPSEPIYPPPTAVLAPSATARRDAARAAREPEHRLAPAAVRAVRLDRRLAHGPPPRAGRRRRARAARRQRARGQHRRQRPPRRRRPVPRHDRGRARVRGQPRLRRRRAARHDQQPELRQPREAAHRLAADRVGARARRGLPRARARRSSAATSRSTTRARPGRSTRRR